MKKSKILFCYLNIIKELSFELSNCRILSADVKVRITYMTGGFISGENRFNCFNFLFRMQIQNILLPDKLTLNMYS